MGSGSEPTDPSDGSSNCGHDGDWFGNVGLAHHRVE
jgi:hypothetical protein